MILGIVHLQSEAQTVINTPATRGRVGVVWRILSCCYSVGETEALVVKLVRRVDTKPSRVQNLLGCFEHIAGWPSPKPGQLRS